MAKIAFLGLGVMGGPMAGHLLNAGHAVTVYNRTASKAADWVGQYGGQSAATPAEAADGVDAVIACVGADADVEAVTLGPDGAFAAMHEGTLWIDHTTVSAKLARKLAEAGEPQGIHCVDAPVSGGQAGAEDGKLAIMCGGTLRGMTLAEPIMRAYAARIVHCGDAGAGQQTKMCNQLAIAGVLQGLSEALHFAKRSDLDLDRVFEAISGGAAQSWQMDNRWKTMAEGEFDFGFAVDWMRKDLGLAIDEAEANDATLELAKLVDGYYAQVQEMGGARQDTSSLVRRLEE
ncbi:NAD(P)-dependent oxidoreductase [Parasphingopyxis algicola]|uniref:NAD(P)-dependent oxidoreductase n=1 Tax=Parasphingopyxis algicola TaxID=2026624 RepID=UPI0015A04C2D|nr:NAD(P)-dependent oxidoreductase [Parasphingopyxis algicola]QLC25089.1 NAD(P)-dependent oxidoreductase [Parasphingopyxis algicola]